GAAGAGDLAAAHFNIVAWTEPSVHAAMLAERRAKDAGEAFREGGGRGLETRVVAAGDNLPPDVTGLEENRAAARDAPVHFQAALAAEVQPHFLIQLLVAAHQHAGTGE